MNKTTVVSALLLSVLLSVPQTSHAAASDALPRIDRNIDAGWKFLRSDAPGAQAPAFDDSSWKSVDLPYTWPTEIGNGRASYYSGPAWYRSHLNIGEDLAGKSLFIRFGAASRVADIYLNGEKAGSHHGPYSAFCIDITKLARPGDNVLAVRVDNSMNRGVAPLSGDFTVFGGLFREVHLLALNPVSITPLDDAGPGTYFRATVSDTSADVDVTTKLRNDSDKESQVTVLCTIADASGKAVQQSNATQTITAHSTADATQKLTVAQPHLWNGRIDPYVYQATVEVKNGDAVIDRVIQPLGLRYFKVDLNQGFILNGKPYDLHGVNFHEGRTTVGAASTPAMDEEDNALICEMGCTAVRMAHYQHNENEIALCDKSGVVVWAELALVNRMADTPEFKDNVKQQLRELIKQNYNHPSVCFWSMYNEPWVNPKDGTQEQWTLIRDLVELSHQLDPMRLTTGGAAPGTGGPILWYMDVTGMNRYAGWYVGGPDEWPKMVAAVRSEQPDKLVGISEYGAGGSVKQHENHPPHPKPGSKWHPEEWEALVHEGAWPAMQDQHWMWCKLIWCMFDFDSVGRNEGDTPGINDKGLVTGDRKTRKDAFYYYKANWTTEPFVHITDQRFNPRPPGPSELKVYSNCPSVELSLNGKSLGSQTHPNHIFVWSNVDLPKGDVDVKAVGTAEGKTVDESIQWHVDPATPNGHAP